MKKNILISISLFIIIFLAINSVQPIFRNKVKTDFKPIEIQEADKQKLDTKMTLSFLYNISKNKHPSGSPEIYEVKDYIVNQLTEMKVESSVQKFSFDSEDLYNKIKQKFENEKNEMLDEIKSAASPEELEESLLKAGYKNFDEFYQYSILEGATIEEATQRVATWQKDYYPHMWDEAKNNTKEFNNILVKLESNTESNKSVLFVAHYDSDYASYGASDNGIYIASILEVLRNLDKSEIKNNIYFLFTDTEEAFMFLGAEHFLENNPIDKNIDLVINFDNIGASGNMMLYQTSSNKYNLINSYFKSIKNENTYSFAKSIHQKMMQYNIVSLNDTEASVFLDKGYNVLNFALIGNKENYHTSNDTIYNIDIQTAKNTTETIFDMAKYYGSCNLENISQGNEMFYFKIWDGIMIFIPKIIYNIFIITISIISSIFIIYKIVKTSLKENIVTLLKNIIILLSFSAVAVLSIVLLNFTKINVTLIIAFVIPLIIVQYYILANKLKIKAETFLLFLLTVISITCFILLNEIAFLFVLPLIFILLGKLIKNKKIKVIYQYITYFIYVIVSLQLITLFYLVIDNTFKIVITVLYSYIMLNYAKQLFFKK